MMLTMTMTVMAIDAAMLMVLILMTVLPVQLLPRMTMTIMMNRMI